jgi:hypothetical protein
VTAKVERALDLLIRYLELKVEREEYRSSRYQSPDLRNWADEREKEQ